MNKKTLIILLGLSFLLFVLKIRICPFFNFLHIPCPACGLTRAFILLFQGRIIESIRYNLLAIILCIGFLIYFIVLLINQKKKFDDFMIEHQKLFVALAFIMMITIEIININNDLLY